MNLLFFKTLRAMMIVIATLVIGFFLTRLSTHDSIDTILAGRGIDHYSPAYFDAYNRLSNELERNSPLFYFTIQPHYFPKTWPAVWSEMEIDMARTLLNKRYRWDAVSDAISSYMEILNDCDLQSACQLAIENSKAMGMLKSSEKVKSTLYLPTIRWNGPANQFHSWIKKMIRGDLGESIVNGRKVVSLIGGALPWTFILSLSSFLISIFCGLLVGTYTALYYDRRRRKVIDFILYAIYAVPIFWVASLMIVFFTTPEYGSWTNIFPSPIFKYTKDSGFLDTIIRNGTHLILPLLCMCLVGIPAISRLVQKSILTESVKSYVPFARSKGLAKRYIFKKHILPNAMIPITTMITSALPSVLAGSLIIEVIFNIPGMGRLLFRSVTSGDWDVVIGILLITAICTNIIFILADHIYKKVDPRISI